MSVPPSSRAPRGRQLTPTSRLGRALRWLRWPVLVIWVLAIVVLHPLAASLYQVVDTTASANLPASAPSTRVAAREEIAQGGSSRGAHHDTLAVVFFSAGALTADDLGAIDQARNAVEHLVGKVDGLGAPSLLRRSIDGRAAFFTTDIFASAIHQTYTDTRAVPAVRAAAASAARAAKELHVNVSGAAAVTADGGSTSQNTLLLTAVVIVAIILLIVYRSTLLWIFPMLGSLGSIVVAQAITHALGSAGLTISSLSTSILIVLAFGAASDYALLLIHRYREELRRQRAVEDAMATALRRTLPTLVASAATVVGAMLCLLAAQSASLHGLGPVGAIAILAALFAQTTFLPAMLLLLGRGAFWPRPPEHGDETPEDSRLWTSIGVRVARHPKLVATGAVVFLVSASLGLLVVHSDNDPLSNLKGQPESVAGAGVFAAHFGPGTGAPLIVLTSPEQANDAAAAAESMPVVARVGPKSWVGGYASYPITLGVDPYGAAGAAAVHVLRQRLDHDAPGSLVGGDPAIQYDITQASQHDAEVLIPLVLVVILLIVAVLLRALVAPLILVATTALSFAASFGLANLLWRGLGYAGIESQLPLYIFVFLVALGVDYTIFLAARIREESRHLDTRNATLRGLGVTGGVITAAGLVLAGTFAALTRGPLVDLAEVGSAVAIGVLLDTLLVRTVLVPAAFLTFGDTVWWPRRSP